MALPLDCAAIVASVSLSVYYLRNKLEGKKGGGLHAILETDAEKCRHMRSGLCSEFLTHICGIKLAVTELECVFLGPFLPD